MKFLNLGSKKEKKEPMTVDTFDREEFEKQEEQDKINKKIQEQKTGGIFDNFSAKDVIKEQEGGLSEDELRILNGI